MKTKRLPLAAGLLLAASAAGASDWIFLVGDGKSDLTVAVEMTSVSAKRGKVSAWTQISNKSPQSFTQLVPGVDVSKQFKTIKMLMVFDCAEKSSATSSAAYYGDMNGGGTFLGSYSRTPSIDDFAPVIPDSLGETIMQFVCKHPNGVKWEDAPEPRPQKPMKRPR